MVATIEQISKGAAKKFREIVDKIRGNKVSSGSKVKNVPYLVFPHALRDVAIAADTGKSEDFSCAFIKFVPQCSYVNISSLKDFKKPAESPRDPAFWELTDDKGSDVKKSKVVKEKLDIDAILLPIIPTEDTIVGNWQPVEGMNFGSLGAYASWKLGKMIGGALSTVVPQEVVYALKSGAFGGGIDNPHDKLMFAGHQRRQFQLSWDFMKPSSIEEENELMLILSLFRMSSIGGYGNLVITPPITWKISFHSMPNYKEFLRYKRCAFASVGVKFGGEGKEFKAMQTGAPFVSLSLDVNELDYPERDDVFVNKLDENELDTIINNSELDSDETYKQEKDLRDIEETFKKLQSGQ